MDTTLEEEDNTDISQPIVSESDTLIQPTLGGVTDMDGVSNDAPTPNLETGTGTEQNTPQAENNLDGVTDDDHSQDPISSENSNPNNEPFMQPLDSETAKIQSTSVDGVTTLQTESETNNECTVLPNDTEAAPMDGVTETSETNNNVTSQNDMTVNTAESLNEAHTGTTVYGTLGEMITHTEFPEKTLLLGGVTTENGNNDTSIATQLGRNNTLPDLVSKNNNTPPPTVRC